MGAWSVGVAIALLSAWANRDVINPDGLSYIDIASAWRDGRFADVVNGWWSPLYSLLIAGTFAFVEPSAEHELLAVRWLNVGIFLGSLAAFEFVLGAFLERLPAIHGGDERTALASQGAWRILAYALFLWSAHVMIGVGLVTPDQCIAATVYCLTGLLIRLRREGPRRRTFFALGVVLGLGYLAKAAMFPLAICVLVAATIASGRSTASISGGIIATVAFLGVTAPWITALSVSKGRLTTGDVGKFAYAHYVSGDEAGGAPLHPPRIVLDSPRVLEFATPVGGTYPLGYDPSYWRDGITPRFVLRRQIQVTAKHLFDNLSLLAPHIVALLTIALRPRVAVERRRAWDVECLIGIPAVATIVMYALVHSETRFLGGAYVVLTLASLSAAARLRDGQSVAVRATLLALAIVLCVPLAKLVYDQTLSILTRRAESEHVRVGRALRAMGIDGGGQLAWVWTQRYPPPVWARLAGARVVAEIREQDAENFWAGDQRGRRLAEIAFWRAGVRVIVANPAPGRAASEGWLRVAGTDYWLRDLRSSPPASAGIDERSTSR